MKISLKAARVNVGLTQTDAAELIGVNVNTIKNWECGKSFPNQPMIDRLCSVYGLAYDQINFLPEGSL